MEGGGLRILEFKREKTFQHEVIVLQETEWTLPIDTNNLDPLELATRVRFESNNVVRFITTITDRDLLYSLDEDRE